MVASASKAQVPYVQVKVHVPQRVLSEYEMTSHSVSLLRSRSRSQFLRLARLVLVVLLPVVRNDVVNVRVMPGRDVMG